MNYSYCCGLDHRSTFLFQYQVKTKQKQKKNQKNQTNTNTTTKLLSKQINQNTEWIVHNIHETLHTNRVWRFKI